MAKKTIATFRAENGIYIKNLADKLQVDEAYLDELEKSCVGNTEIENKIVELYGLPIDYFEPTSENTIRITPAKPFNFLFKESLIWMIFVYLIRIAIELPNIPLAMLGIENLGTIMGHLETIASSFITIFFTLHLSKRIMKNSTYGEEVKKYNYILYYFSAAVVSSFGSIFSYVLFRVFPMNGSTADITSVLVQGSIYSLIGIIQQLLQTFVIAMILETLIIEDKIKAKKTIQMLSIIAILSTASGFVIGGLANTDDLGHFIFVLVLRFVMLFLILYGINYGGNKNEKLWLKTLPIILIFGYDIIAFVIDIVKIFNI